MRLMAACVCAKLCAIICCTVLCTCAVHLADVDAA